MLKRALSILLLISLLLGAVCARGEEATIPNIKSIYRQEIPDNEAMAFVKDMKIGWNLGNTFDATNDGYVKDDLTIESYWCGVKTTEEMIEAVHQAGFNTLGHQISDCCCTTQRAIDGVNYNMATQANALQQAMCTNTRDIIDSQQAGTRAILDFLTQDKISSLQSENQALRFQASQNAQNSYLAALSEAQTAELVRRGGSTAGKEDHRGAGRVPQDLSPVHLQGRGLSGESDR